MSFVGVFVRYAYVFCIFDVVCFVVGCALLLIVRAVCGARGVLVVFVVLRECGVSALLLCYVYVCHVSCSSRAIVVSCVGVWRIVL